MAGDHTEAMEPPTEDEKNQHPQDLIAAGKLRLEPPGSLDDIEPLPPRADGRSLTEAVIDMRREENR